MDWEEANKVLDNIQTIKALSNGRPGFISGIEQSILFDLAEFLNGEVERLKEENGKLRTENGRLKMENAALYEKSKEVE